MKNVLANFGTKLVYTMVAAGLVVGTAAAASVERVIMTVDKPVAVGSVVLPSGQYTITQSSNSVFVIRGENGDAIAAVAPKVADAEDRSHATGVVLTETNGALRLDKLFFAGESTGYQFGK